MFPTATLRLAPRRTLVRPLLGAALGVLMATSAARAQETRRTVGVTFHRSTSSRAIASQAVSVSSVEVDVSFPILDSDWWRIEYEIAIPVALVHDNPTGAVSSFGDTWVVWNPPPPTTTLGIGAQPVGIRALVGPRRARLQLDASGGFIRFGTPLLAANGTRFNFTADAGVGVRLALPDRGYAVAGYRLHHVSNGGLGEVNPGLDAHELYLGVLFE